MLKRLINIIASILFTARFPRLAKIYFIFFGFGYYNILLLL